MAMAKKANGEGNIRRRSDGTWEARFYVDGQRKSVYGKTKTDVRRKLTEKLGEVDNDAYIDETNLTVAQWMTTWLEEYAQVRDSTRERYEVDIRLHIIPAIGKIKLRELTPMQVQHLYAEVQHKRMSGKSIRNLHGVLHAALKTAVNMDLLKRNVTEQCMLPKVEHPEMHPLLDEDTKRFLDAVKEDSFHDVLIFTLFTGLREGEVLGLTWDCVSFEKKTIRVYRQMKNISSNLNRRQYTFTPLKNSRPRLIEPADQIMELLKRVRQEQTENKDRLGSSYSNKDGLIFTYADGGHIPDHTLYNHFKEIVRGIGRPEVRFHDLRHTFATLALENGSDYKTVSMLLGHATAAFTLDRYGHVSSAMRADSASKMTRFISGLDAAI